MKNIIFSIFFILLFFIWNNNVFSWKYWLHSEPYWSSWKTTCSDDNDWISDPRHAKVEGCLQPEAWTMQCYYWDWQPPTSNWVSYSPSGWTKSDVIVTVACKDTWWSWCSQLNFSSPPIGSNWSWNVTIEDNALNSENITYTVSNIDKIPPTSGWVSYSPSGWTDSDVTVTVICNDTWWSWCSQLNFSSPPIGSNWSWNVTIEDNALNSENITYTVNNIDRTPPWISYNLTWWIHDTRTNNNVTASIFCSDSQSWCDSNSYQYKIWDSTCSSGWVWSQYTTQYVFNPISGTNLIDYICFRAKDNVWNWYSYSSVAIIKIDKNTPSSSDIFSPTPRELLATNNQNFEINVDNNSWSPITHIYYYFENYNSTNSMINIVRSALSDTIINSEYIENVDLDREWNWARDYRLQVSKICDEAGNCTPWTLGLWTDIKTIHYNVYANTLASAFTTKSATTNLDDTLNIANWVEKNIIITLKDVYWNQIVPASWINREIDFQFNYDNYLYSNQYTSTWNSVYSKNPTWAWFTNNDFNIWTNINLRFVNETSFDWEYIYDFKIYSPTFGASGWQELVNTNAEFDINSIEVDVIWDIWTNIWTLIMNSSIPPSTITITSNFKPIYYTEITWDLDKWWIVEWVYQESHLEVKQNWSISWLWNIYIEFWSGAMLSSPKLNMEMVIGTATWMVWEWNNLLDGGKLYKNNFDENDLYDLSTLVTLFWWLLDDIANSYISSHIAYMIDGHEVKYNSDIIWKSNYMDWASIITTYLEWLKVIWKTHSLKQVDLTINQEWKDLHILWNIEKSSVKEQIVKNAYNVVKNLSTENWINKKVNDLWDFSITSTNDWKKLGNILYFWDLTSGEFVNIEASWSLINWQKTIVAIWNIYITENIEKNNNSILGIIALKDSNWDWWNIYVNPSVTIIEAILYADKSLMSSVDWINELDWNANQYTLRNQLYIHWSVFSENTIWWSRNLPNPICPYYIIENSCDLNTAQKFDLNYLRRYYVKSGVVLNWWINYFDDYTWWWTNYNWWWYSYYNYPIVIKYDPTIQNTPPPFFEK